MAVMVCTLSALRTVRSGWKRKAGAPAQRKNPSQSAPAATCGDVLLGLPLAVTICFQLGNGRFRRGHSKRTGPCVCRTELAICYYNSSWLAF